MPSVRSIYLVPVRFALRVWVQVKWVDVAPDFRWDRESGTVRKSVIAFVGISNLGEYGGDRMCVEQRMHFVAVSDRHEG